MVLATSGHARDVWVVHGVATTPTRACAGVQWSAGGVLHNVSNEPAIVTVAHVSTGGVPVSATTRTVPARRSVPAHPLGPFPFAGPSLWVMRLSVTDNIRVDARVDQWEAQLCPPQGIPPSAPFAKIPMPVFERLAPPGQEQVHPGTDLAAQSARLNVGIYNAGILAATAVVRVHAPFCVQADIGSIATGVPPDAVVQVPIPTTAACAGDPFHPGWATYVTVTVDQPSLTFVSVLSQVAPPTATSVVVAPQY